MAENNSKTFIIGIIIFVLLVIGGFAFFAKKDVAVDQTTAETAAPAPEGAMTQEVTPAPAPAAEIAPAPAPANNPEVTTAPAVEGTPAPNNEPVAPGDTAPVENVPGTATATPESQPAPVE